MTPVAIWILVMSTHTGPQVLNTKPGESFIPAPAWICTYDTAQRKDGTKYRYILCANIKNQVAAELDVENCNADTIANQGEIRLWEKVGTKEMVQVSVIKLTCLYGAE